MIRSRYYQIVFFFARLTLSMLVWDVGLPKIGLGGWAAATRTARMKRAAQRFRRLAVRLGGVPIKLGQWFSARADVLPPDVLAELATLQDEVPAESFEAVRAVAESELGAPLSMLFASFEVQPLAAASIGQAHRAVLHPARAAELGFANVVVKIQRPNIALLIRTDLTAFYTVSRWLKRYPPISKRANLTGLLQEFEQTLQRETDYIAEGNHADQFRFNFSRLGSVRIPRIAWLYTSSRVITLEDVSAIKITDYTRITANGIDRKAVAARLFDVYLRQLFEHGFFHADPHPGNLIVQPGKTPNDWQLTFIDFGMVGDIKPALRDGLRDFAIAITTRDAQRLINSYKALGVLLPNADTDLLVQASTKAFEQFWGKSTVELREIGYEATREFVAEFRELLYEMPFQVPDNLIFLGRTVELVSGVCVGLDPHFNVWQAIYPYAQKLVAEQLGNRQFWQTELLNVVRTATSLPGRLNNTLERIEKDQLQVRMPQNDRRLTRIERNVQTLSHSIGFAALLLGGVQLYLGQQQLLGVGFWLAAGGVMMLGWMRRVR